MEQPPVVLRNNRYDRDIGLECEMESAFLERTHLRLLRHRPCAFRVYPETGLERAHLVTGCCERSLSISRVAPVDEYSSGEEHPWSESGVPAEFLLGKYRSAPGEEPAERGKREVLVILRMNNTGSE